MEYLFIYCLQIFERIDIINYICWGIFGTSVFVWLFTYILIETDDYTENLKNVRDLFKKISIYLLLVSLITTLVPTKNTLLLMGGLYLGKKAISTVITDEKIKKIDTIINIELDKRIKELKEE